MDFNRCSRCGSFYVSQGNVCPNCSTKDNFEFSNFVSFIKENGLENSPDSISESTGISVTNINRFLNYNEYKGLKSEIKKLNKNIINNTNLK